MSLEPVGNALLDRFFQYLEERCGVPATAVVQAKKFFRVPGALRIGQVTILMRMLKPSDVVSIIAEQVDSDLRFGELAVRAGRLTQEQVDLALAAQADRCAQAVEVLRGLGSFEDKLSKPNLDGFAPWLSDKGFIIEATAPTLAAKVDGERVRERLRLVSKVATLPVVVQRVLALIDDPNSSLETIGKTLEGDAPIAAQALRLANSAIFARREKASSVQRALVVLGTKNVKQVVLAATIMSQCEAGTTAEMRHFWHHSILAGQWARALAEVSTDKATPPEDAFIAGLMANLGELVIRQTFPKESKAIAALVNQGTDQLTAELECLGLTHPGIGAHFAHLWHFPASLEEAILYHHAAPSSLRKLGVAPITHTVNTATRLAELAPGSEVLSGMSMAHTDFEGVDGGSRATLAMAPRVFESALDLTAALFGSA